MERRKRQIERGYCAGTKARLNRMQIQIDGLYDEYLSLESLKRQILLRRSAITVLPSSKSLTAIFFQIFNLMLLSIDEEIKFTNNSLNTLQKRKESTQSSFDATCQSKKFSKINQIFKFFYYL